MKENVGMIDRMIRFILAIIFIILGFVYPAYAILWFILAAIALITGLLGWCGLYALLKCSTSSETKPLPKPVKKAKKKK